MKSVPATAGRDASGPYRAARSAGGNPPLALFFLISHGFSWLFWLSAAAMVDADVWSSPARWLVYLGGLGPPLAGVACTWLIAGRAGLRELGARILDPRGIGTRWLLALFIPVAAMAVAVAAALLLDPRDPAFDASRLMQLLGTPPALAGFALFVLVLGPLPEEIGWRGYALDALQARHGALLSSLLLGAAWALWHLPLFLIPGYYREGVPPALLFTTAILVHSVLYTWLHNNTGRSVLVAILFHFMVNLVGMLVEGSAWVEWVRTGVTAAVAVFVLAAYGGRTLRGSGGSQSRLAPPSG
jgi:uncharacterized protein